MIGVPFFEQFLISFDYLQSRVDIGLNPFAFDLAATRLVDDVQPSPIEPSVDPLPVPKPYPVDPSPEP